jgi:hypothetical protein
MKFKTADPNTLVLDFGIVRPAKAVRDEYRAGHPAMPCFIVDDGDYVFIGDPLFWSGIFLKKATPINQKGESHVTNSKS